MKTLHERITDAIRNPKITCEQAAQLLNEVKAQLPETLRLGHLGSQLVQHADNLLRLKSLRGKKVSLTPAEKERLPLHEAHYNEDGDAEAVAC